MLYTFEWKWADGDHHPWNRTSQDPFPGVREAGLALAEWMIICAENEGYIIGRIVALDSSV